MNQMLRICAGATLSLACIALLAGCVSVEAKGSFPETLADTGATKTQSELSRHTSKSFDESFDEVVEFVKVFCGEGNVKSVSVSNEDGKSLATSVECYGKGSDQELTE